MNESPHPRNLAGSQTPPAVEIRHLSKLYGAQRALDDVSLTVDAGVFLTLLGPSGSGKSSLLRSVAGFADPTSGSIHVDGHDVTREPPHRRPVGMVFQDYALFPHMTVRQNIAFGCEMRGQSRPAIAERCRQMLELIRMPDVGDRHPTQLSGGQRQRVALARALAPDPVLLLLDEPLGALDLKLRRQMQHELKEIQRETGKTFVFVTHDQEEAMSMSDLIAVMRDGRIEQLGTPEHIYRNPANAFVAAFIGDANLIRARVVEVAGETIALKVGRHEWRVPTARVTAARMPERDATVVLVLRPEDLRVSGPAAQGDLVLSAAIEDRTFLGGHVRLHLRDEDGREFVAESRHKDVERLTGRFDMYCAVDAVAVVLDTAHPKYADSTTA